MRTAFLGTSEFAAAVLSKLVGEPDKPGPHSPTIVLTRPDRPAGRGRRPTAPAVAQAARALGLELAQPENVNDPSARELIARTAPDAIVVCAFGALIKEPLLSDYELLNVHPSLLPRWRGAAPIERAIMAGDKHTGVSIMRLTAGLDSGPVCLAAGESVRPEDTYGSLSRRLEKIGGDLLVGALDVLERGGQLHFEAQDESSVTYAEKIDSTDRLLDPLKPAVELERVVRALQPHIGARAVLGDGTMLGVQGAALTGERPAAQGIYASEGRVLLGCSESVLELLVVQPAGKRPMDASAFLRGHGLPTVR